jgi:hypothetical protein
MREWLRLVVRGLFRTVVKENLPGECTFDIRLYFRVEVERMLALLGTRATHVIHRGDGVFSAVCWQSEETYARSVWLLEFYESVHYFVATLPPTAAVESNADHAAGWQLNAEWKTT